jgi:hypothetical protein
MEDTSGPKIVEFDLTEFLVSGNLLNVNEKVLWKMGLALTVHYDSDSGEANGLFISQWSYPDGHCEIIGGSDDVLTRTRHAAFEEWVRARAAKMSVSGEAEICLSVLER